LLSSTISRLGNPKYKEVADASIMPSTSQILKGYLFPEANAQRLEIAFLFGG